ncbi:MAG: glycerol-3-phosphate dehydrogenase [Candidatus Marinimicrobia bacterium]|mgnify:FL=1|nr:glycerol-3-phosphate dehydrogenase [Candidatus Neomarinimicrobiota bacterium]|tara:strand:+ start:186 stop:1175 length:990 start_codon:yes stop_codon:yes gene_type:complete
MQVAVLGAGSWGTALALVLSQNKNISLTIYHHNNYYDTNKTFKYFDTIQIPDEINITNDKNDIKDYDIYFIVQPTEYVYASLSWINDNSKSKNPIIVNCAKGFSYDHKMTFYQVVCENFINLKDNYCVLSGPSHAEEVIKKLPTAVVVASNNQSKAKLIQDLFSTNYFRIYTNSDVIGVEVGAACKNIISIAAGICIGLNYGENTIAALISRGLNEMKLLGTYFGGNEETFNGLSGIGDLTVTAYSKHSRNRAFGVLIGKGYQLDNAYKEIKMHVEGISATKTVHKILKNNKIIMPIVSQVYSILFDKKNPEIAINQLMDRKLKHEMIK